MVEFRTANFGNAIQQGQDIKLGRMKNQVAQQQLDESQNSLKSKQQAEQVRAMYDKMPDQIDELERLGNYEQADKVRQSYVSQLGNSYKIMDQVRQKTKTQEDYDRLRSPLIQAGVVDNDMMPAKYADSYFDEKQKETLEKIEKVTRKSVKNGIQFEQEFIRNSDGGFDPWGDATEIGQSARLNREQKAQQFSVNQAAKSGKSAKAGKPYRIDNATTTNIRNEVNAILDIDNNPVTGARRYNNSDVQATDAASMRREVASILRNSEGEIDIQEASVRAAKKLGIKVRNLGGNPGDINTPATEAIYGQGQGVFPNANNPLEL